MKTAGLHASLMGENPDHVIVGVGELAIGRHPQVLVTQALGSCVGVCLWDKRLKAGALAHVMLPVAPVSGFSGRPDRFADLAVPKLVDGMLKLGSNTRSLIAKLAGGAAMFHGEPGIDTIGSRNVEAVIRQLDAYGITAVSSDTGGSHARTIEFDLGTGALLVRSYTFGSHHI